MARPGIGILAQHGRGGDATGIQVVDNPPLQGARGLVGDRTVDLQILDGPSILASQRRAHAARSIIFYDLAEIGMRQCTAQRKANIEMRVILVARQFVGIKRDDDIGVLALRTNVGGGVRFTDFEIAQNPFFGITQLRRIALLGCWSKGSEPS